MAETATLKILPEVKEILDNPPPFQWNTPKTPGNVWLIVLMVLENWWVYEFTSDVGNLNQIKEKFPELFSIKADLERLGKFFLKITNFSRVYELGKQYC